MKKEKTEIRIIRTDKMDGAVLDDDIILIEDSIIKNMKGLLRYCKEEYGVCVNEIYADLPNGNASHIGYMFEKRMQCDGSTDTYIQEVWATLEHYIEECTKTLFPLESKYQ